MFKKGDLVSYPSHGVAVVKDVSERTIGAKVRNCYQLQVKSNGVTLLVDVEFADQAGLRAIARPEELRATLAILATEPEYQHSTWNRRFREYMDKMQSNSLKSLAEVARDVHHRRKSQDLSYGEKKMIDRALNLLTCEASASLSLDLDAAEALVLSYLP